VSCRSRTIVCQFDSTKDGRRKEGRELIFKEQEDEKTLFEDSLHTLITTPAESHNAFMMLIRQSESAICLLSSDQRDSSIGLKSDSEGDSY
jgi:hypothetical protein